MKTFFVILLALISPHVFGATTVILEYNTGQPQLTPIATAPGTQVLIPYYTEDGFISKPLGPILSTPPYSLALAGPATSFFPENGTAYVQLLRGGSFEVYDISGALFSAVSIDLAEYSTGVPAPRIIGFSGTRRNGMVVRASFTTDGIITSRNTTVDFQTFNFPSDFTDLVNLRADDGLFSLDNLVLNKNVPEPSSVFLLLLGLVTCLIRKRRN